jgi:Cu(I)/Ag(I) efflux system membrane protein CusA/SilA
MIERIIEFSIRRPWLVIAAAALLAVWGIQAIYRTPIDAIPDLSENQVIVFTDWPGHTPREIEDQVTYPLALQLQGLAGVRTVRSSSDIGFSMISVIFEDNTGFESARRSTGDALASSAATLPAGVTPRLAPDADATGQIFWYTVEAPGCDLGRLRAIQDWYIRPQLASVAGVAEVASVGGMVAEYQIELNPDRLKAYGVAPNRVVEAIGHANAAAGGNVIQNANAEYVVRSDGRLGARAGEECIDPQRVLQDLECIPLVSANAKNVLVRDVACVSMGPGPRRGVLEKDGNEVTGGVVLMHHGENPHEVTKRLREKIEDIQATLPAGAKIVPFYDRTPLIDAAVGGMARTLVEAILIASICIFVVLLHIRTSFIIALTLPLTVLASFGVMDVLRRLGVVDVQTNLMSLAGLAISIGVLVDSSIVMAENAMHHLKARFGERPVTGDTRELILPACRTVGRPIFFAILIMLLSFLPVLALGGVEGKMFRPLAFTKMLALVAVGVLAITLVPALCSFFIKGRLRSEQQVPLVRGLIQVYRPVLNYFLDRPVVLVWFVGLTMIVGLAPVAGKLVLPSPFERFPVILLGSMVLALTGTLWAARTRSGKIIGAVSLVIAGLVAEQRMKPLETTDIVPLDEGMVMDMPITVPRASVTESLDDLKARDMVLCQFPEVRMVVGKAGRAETPTDPAPLDMIETMIDFRPHELWPKRCLRAADAERQARAVLDALVTRGIVAPFEDPAGRAQAVAAKVLPLFDAQMRIVACHRYAELERSRKALVSKAAELSTEQVHEVNGELLERAPMLYTWLVREELLDGAVILDARIPRAREQWQRLREGGGGTAHHDRGGHHHGARSLPEVDPVPVLDDLQTELVERFSRGLLLWPRERTELAGFGGELDSVMQMPGWANVWTMPIQNRVDMLSTGVNTAIGVRVLGPNLEDVVRASKEIAAVLKTVKGAIDVVSDPVRDKGYLEVHPRREKLGELGVNPGAVNDLVEIAMGGKVVTTTVEGRERHPVRVRYARDYREDETSLSDLPVLAGAGQQSFYVPLESLADIKVVEGPATIKSENGLLRNYVRLNVRGRDAEDFVAEARKTVASQVNLRPGVHVEWTGRYQHQASARRTLLAIIPLVTILICLILWWTYRDWADAALLLLTLPAVVAGGVFCQWLFGYPLSVTVWIGYVACLGMAISTAVIMLVYMREAVAKAGGLENITVDQLREAVLQGAVHRLRPKLLTEATVILGLAPLLWAGGPGADILRPMVIPVLGGILIADEIIDLFLPVLFYQVRCYRLKRVQRA